MTRGPNRITRFTPAGPAGLRHDQRVIAVRVLDLTHELVERMVLGEWPQVTRLLGERRALLERLPRTRPAGEDGDCVRALRAAVEESDRAMGLLLAGADLHWSATSRQPGDAGAD
jgi:hypothetical protein